MTDPTNSTRDARALIVAHGAAQAIDAIASVLIRLWSPFVEPADERRRLATIAESARRARLEADS